MMNKLECLQNIKQLLLKSGKKPDFNNLIKVLRREKTSIAVPFEFSVNYSYLEAGAGYNAPDGTDSFELLKFLIDGYTGLGYDYATFAGGELCALLFDVGDTDHKDSRSLNSGSSITNRAEFEDYDWPDPDAGDYSTLEKIKDYLPDNFKLVVSGPGGVLENVIDLVGFDSFALMLCLDIDLVKDIIDAVGSRLLKYYENVISYDSVGAIISNDDWGFKTQTMIDPNQIREFIAPWHKRIVEVAHKANKPAILHSCGNLSAIMDDIIDDLKFDGKHSYEDIIIPVEEAYKTWGNRISIMGGLDVDFLCRETPENIQERVKDLITLTKDNGGAAIGSGNSIPEYMPVNNYCAMLESTLFSK